MNPQPLEDFLADLNIEVSGVPRIYMLEALRRICIEFCEQTLLVRETMPSMTLSPNVDTYELEPALCNSEVCRVLDVWIDDNIITAVTPKIGRAFDMTMSASAPSGYYCTQPGELHLVPPPTAANVMVADIAIKPAHDAVTVPNMLFTQYKEIIIRGAAAKLMLMPSRPWTNVQHATLYRKLYWNAMHSIARQDHWHGFGQPIHRASSSFL